MIKENRLVFLSPSIKVEIFLIHFSYSDLAKCFFQIHRGQITVRRHGIDRRFQTFHLKMYFVSILLVKGFKVQNYSNPSIIFWPYKNVRFKSIRICLHNRFNYSFLSKD